ncbi:HAD family hydrolase [Brucella intermedia]|uniref:HAD family hydrolase n=1 Tax=Brucella intermedia TaxID=94625 RepID=UPI00224A8240|nr:HAD family hydrolase [Brucella intermedia]
MAMPSEKNIEIFGIDADDTLWSHAGHYVLAEQALCEILSDYGESTATIEHLRRVEARNLPLYGFGVKGFTLSMIEVATERAGANLSPAIISEIVGMGRALLEHPIELLPSVQEGLERLASEYRLVLITKGDLLDQERKLAESGLRSYFDAADIVSNKTREVYEKVFRRYTHSMNQAVMIGDSLRSDILPAVEAGAWGIHIPQNVVWSLDHADKPNDTAAIRQVEEFGGVVSVIDEIELLVDAR